MLAAAAAAKKKEISCCVRNRTGFYFCIQHDNISWHLSINITCVITRTLSN
jgi:hypothetical protein